VRVLLDECLPRRLKRDLVGHDAKTAPEMGWAGKKNGELLTVASAEFDVSSRPTATSPTNSIFQRSKEQSSFW